MRNLFAIAAILAATSSAFDYEATAQSPMKSYSRRHQRFSDRPNKRGGVRASWRPAPRTNNSGRSQTSSHQRNPWVTTSSWSNANRSK